MLQYRWLYSYSTGGGTATSVDAATGGGTTYSTIGDGTTTVGGSIPYLAYLFSLKPT